MWVAVVVGLPICFAVGYLVRRTRPLILRTAQSAAAIAIMATFLLGIHRVEDLASLQIPLAHAFLWLLLLHALDTPNRRGLMVLLVASLVLVSLAGVLSISMAIAPWLLIWALASLVALRLGYRAELAELPELGRPRSRPPRRDHVRHPGRDPRRCPAARLRGVHARPRRPAPTGPSPSRPSSPTTARSRPAARS